MSTTCPKENTVTDPRQPSTATATVVTAKSSILALKTLKNMSKELMVGNQTGKSDSAGVYGKEAICVTKMDAKKKLGCGHRCLST